MFCPNIQGGPLVRESPISHLFKRNVKKIIYRSCADTCGAYFKNIVHYTGWPKKKIQTKRFFLNGTPYIFFHFQIPQLILVIFDETYYMPKPNCFLDSYDFVVKS